MVEVGCACAIVGKPDEVRKVLAQLDAMAKDAYIALYNLAVVHAGLGTKDAAFAALERMFNERSYLLVEY